MGTMQDVRSLFTLVSAMIDDGLGLGLNSGLDEMLGPRLVNGLNRFGWFKPWKA